MHVSWKSKYKSRQKIKVKFDCTWSKMSVDLAESIFDNKVLDLAESIFDNKVLDPVESIFDLPVWKYPPGACPSTARQLWRKITGE